MFRGRDWIALLLLFAHLSVLTKGVAQLRGERAQEV
ncbi:MAG: hypothetical protein JWQ89_4126 [Devosia sp.]|nr:hypothetical protein [Devosia sp.]